MEQLLSS